MNEIPLVQTKNRMIWKFMIYITRKIDVRQVFLEYFLSTDESVVDLHALCPY